MDFPRVALSIRQPWANRILVGGKDIENRTWRTSFRGPVLIHAAQAIDPFAGEDAALGMRRGGIVGVMEIVDCVTQSASPWFGGPYGFVLCNPRPLRFAPCRGKLGFFTPAIDFTTLEFLP
ncbi:MAG: ASCH domain-containing protein [Magnetospirillum sp.]|nr:ASCH domain-containing protein [Magnetospirillum sp.]